MKSVKIKISQDETVFYRQGVFKGEEELIIFSLEDFLKFKKELKECLDSSMKIVDDSRNKRSANVPSVDAQRLLNWIRRMEAELEKIGQTDIQKNLNSYNK